VLRERYGYSAQRLQMEGVDVERCATVGCGSAEELLHLEYAYGSKNNGNPREQVIRSAGMNVRQRYEFDGLNRLRQFREEPAGGGAAALTEDYCYDRHGNRGVLARAGLLSKTPQVAACTEEQVLGLFPGNRIAGTVYDAGGELGSDGWNALRFDLEGRLRRSIPGSGAETSYEYDGEGRRVLKQTGQSKTVFVYDAGGQLAAEYGGTVSASGTEYLHGDMLGSTRLVTDGTKAGRRFDYWPFGAELTGGDTAYRTVGFAGTGVTQRFTGKERDEGTGLDYFGARYMSAAQGRFSSPDAPFADQHPADPQSWNLYAYGRNNPLLYVDPTGEAVELLGDEEARKKELALLQSSVGNKQAASRLYINEVKEGDKTRYFVGIKGDVGDFMKLSDTAKDMANLVGHKNVVEFGLTSQNLAKFGGAVTFEKGEAGNQNIRVLVNPDQMDITNRNLSPSTILGMSRWEGQDVRPRWNVNDFTPGVAAWHEFGHAWGFINGRPGSQTNAEALQWENRMRQQVYGPLGPRNAPRKRH